MADCYSEFLAKVRGDLAQKKEAVSYVEQEASNRAEADRSKNFNEHRIDVIRGLVSTEQGLLTRAEAGLAQQVRARLRLNASLNGFLDTEGFTAKRSLSATVDGFANDVSGEAMTATLRLERDMKENGLGKYYGRVRQDREEELNFIKELMELSRSNPQPGLSGSQDAQTAARLYRRHMDALNARLDKVGAGSGTLEDWIVRQVWDPASLQRFTKGQEKPDRFFAKQMLPRINRQRTFKDSASDARVMQFLKDFYNDRVQGEVENVPLSIRDLSSQKTRTFAARQLDQREIHMSRPEDMQFVIENFHPGGLTGSLWSGLRRRAQRTALVENFGVNPPNTVDSLFNEANQASQDRGEGGFGGAGSFKYMQLAQSTNGMLKVASGLDEIDPSSPDLARMGQGLRQFSRMAMLGDVILASIGDLATSTRQKKRFLRAMQRSMQGINREAIDVVQRATKEMSPKTIERIATSLNTAHAYSTAKQMDRITSGGPMAAFVNYSNDAANFMFKAQGMDYFIINGKTDLGVFMHSALSLMRDTGWSDLDPSIRESLLRGRFVEKDWERLRVMDDVFVDIEEQGFAYLDFEKLDGIDADLGRRLASTIRTFADEGFITPGAFERSLLTQGTDPGTVTGQLMRSLSFLLSWPTSVVTRGFMREFRAEGIGGLVALSGRMLAAGAVVTMLKDAAKGEVRDYTTTDPDEMLDLFREMAVRGGLGGVFGDSIMKALDPQFSQGALTSLTSTPDFATLDRVITGSLDTIIETASGDINEAVISGSKVARLAIPVTDLPYTKFFTESLMSNIEQTFGDNAGGSSFNNRGLEPFSSEE